MYCLLNKNIESKDITRLHIIFCEEDQKNNLATVSAYFDVWWKDEFLAWNTTDYDGISKVFVPMKWIWKPEFYMYHRLVVFFCI
ncbi:unnamed protein product [Strongylus vulgaris]|uniref:Neurotransmitter-gated ion-channel ligand-binding domain-containing protein n=1 Tax=Strongylus vulgaris TaxID=40348 RepID=A0A3P7KJZ0_STRVU|nr:unnamed protein product [Strongylus vulgaris]